MRGYRVWFSLLVLIGLLIAVPSHAKGYAERMITAAAETSQQAGRAVLTPAGVDSVSCRMDVTIHDEVGTIAVKIQMCMFPFEIAGSEKCMAETPNSANYQSMLTSSTMATEGVEWLFLGNVTPVGGNATARESPALFPVPIIWRVVSVQTGGNESTYTVDCQWW